MAKLIKCKDCGQEISKQAKTCPHCGKPQVRTSGCVWLALIVIILLVIGAISKMGKQTTPSQPSSQVVVSKPSQGQPVEMPSQNLAAIKAIATYQNPTTKKTVWDSYQEVSQIATELYGWYAIPCPVELCKEKKGYLVSFRVKTSIGQITPMWFVSIDLSKRFWINGTAKSETPDLPQSAGIAIHTALSLIESQPKEAAVVNLE